MRKHFLTLVALAAVCGAAPIVGQAQTPTPAALISPTAGSTLTGSSATFTWNTGTSVVHYMLWLGTTGIGSSNLYDSSWVSGTSVGVTGLPTSGGTIYARLYSFISGAWQYIDYTFIESGTAAPATLSSPTAGSTLSGSSATFNWTVGSGVSKYMLWLGSTGTGSSNLYNSSWVLGNSASVTGLPTGGGTIYARLWSFINGAWQYNDYTFVASGTASPATLSSPTAGSTLSGSSATFNWTAGSGVSKYMFWLGSTGKGTSDLYNSSWVLGTSANVTGLPTSGGTIYARLWSFINGAWQYSDYTFIESGTASPATLTSPTPGSTLSGTSATFMWTTGSGVAKYMLWLGSTVPGSSDLYNSNWVEGTSVNVSSLPAGGGTIFARLWSFINGAWQSNDYTFIESGTASPAVLTTPAPGLVSPLGTSSVSFGWTSGSGVSLYQLWLGSTGAGSSNIYQSGWLTSTSVVVPSLPGGGEVIYARLYSRINGVWQPADYVYTPGYQVSGNIALNNTCGPAGTLPTFNVSINTSPVQNTTTNSSGNYSFTLVPNGTYTITPSLPGVSSLFIPSAATNVVVNGNPVGGRSFSSEVGYTVSGTVSYSGSKTGQVYLNLVNNNCTGSSNGEGTSITEATLTSTGAFSIRGVTPGSYTLQAYMDNLGTGAPNGTNPSGNGSSAVAVSNANVTGQSVTMTDPTVTTASLSAPDLKNITPTDQGVAISFSPITNNSGVETVTSYTVEWSTDPTFATNPGSATFKAVGKNGDVWILNNGTPGITGSFTNGTAYYFEAWGNIPAGSGPVAVWGDSPAAVTIGAPSGAGYYGVSGAVTIPSNVTPTGPLYVGVFDQNTNAVFATEIAAGTFSNSTPVDFTVQAPNGSNYILFALLDQNNDGLIDAGDVTNANDNNSSSVVVNGAPLTGQNQTLPSVNSQASVTSQFMKTTNQNGTSTIFSINIDLRSQNKLPVSVTLNNGPHVIKPVDLTNACQSCGTPQWQYYAVLGGFAPSVGNTYMFFVTYTDGTSETISGSIDNVLGPGNVATLDAPTGTGVSITPTFTWTDPSSASSYTYQFLLTDESGDLIWQIPGQNSNSNGFSSSITSIMWDADPTEGGSTPSVPNLSPSTYYNWAIQVYDSYGDSATTQQYFKTSTNPLVLPSSGSGSAIENMPYGANLAVTGGSGSGYTFTVNSTAVPNNGSAVSLSNGLSASSTGNGTLKISGTPTTLTTVPFTVSATDSASNSAGPVSYSIDVSSGPSGANNSYLSGQYVCEVGGFKDSDSTLWASLFSFTATPGVGTGTFSSGVFDSNGNNTTSYPTAINGTVSGTFNVGSDNNGLASLTTSPSILGTSTSEWAIALNNVSGPTATEFRMVEIDDVGATPSGHTGTADCYQATTSAFAGSTISGNGFVFEVGGTVNGGAPVQKVARFSASSGNVTSGVVDTAKAFSNPTYSNTSLTGGSYTAPSSTTGRFTLTLTNSNGSVNYAAYIVNGLGMFLLETNSESGTVIGRMFTQQQTSYPLSSVNGNSVLYSQGLAYGNGCTLAGYYSELLQGHGDNSGDYTIDQVYENDNGIFGSAGQQSPFTFTADSSNVGRFTANSGTNTTAYVYLYNNSEGVILDVNNSGTSCSDGYGSVDAGYIETQTATTFTNAALAGNYMLGQFPPFTSTATATVGETSIGSSGTYSSNASNGGQGDFNWDQATSGLTYGWSSQTYGTLSIENPGGTESSCAVISGTRMACIQNTSNPPTIFLLQQ